MTILAPTSSKLGDEGEGCNCNALLNIVTDYADSFGVKISCSHSERFA